MDIKQDKFETTIEFEERKIKAIKEYEQNGNKLKNSIFVLNLDSYYSDQYCSYNADMEEWEINLPTELDMIASSNNSPYVGKNALGYETNIEKIVAESDKYKSSFSIKTSFYMNKEVAKKQKPFIIQVLYKIQDVSKDVYSEDYLYQKPTISKPKDFFATIRTLKIRYVGLIVWDSKKEKIIMSRELDY